MEWTPDSLVHYGCSWWGAAALLAAMQIDLFTPLGDGPLTEKELAGRLLSSERGIGILVPAMCALELLQREGDKIALTPFAAKHLVKGKPGYLGYILRHHASLMPRWSQLGMAVRTGMPTGSRPQFDDADREDFLKGMTNQASVTASLAMGAVSFAEAHRLLDLGGGPGHYAIEFCRANPQLTAVVYDLPGTTPIAEEAITNSGLQDRIAFVAGDFLTDPVPGGFDIVWGSQILHSFDENGCQTLINRAMNSLQPGGRLLLQDFYLNDAHNGPLFPTLFGLNMLVGTQGGRTYSQDEIAAMMRQAGAASISAISNLNPNEGLGIVIGVKGQSLTRPW